MRIVSIILNSILEIKFRSKSKTRSRRILLLVSCSKNVSSHKKQHQFQWLRIRIWAYSTQKCLFSNARKYPWYDDYLPVGTAWAWISGGELSKACMQCSGKLSGHSDESKKNAERGFSFAQSKFIMEATGEFIPFDSGNYIIVLLICNSCRSKTLFIEYEVI